MQKESFQVKEALIFEGQSGADVAQGLGICMVGTPTTLVSVPLLESVILLSTINQFNMKARD